VIDLNKAGAFFIFVIIISGALTAACISQAPQTPVLTTVKVAYLPLISSGPLFIAQEEGYFARQGIDVEFEKFQNTAAALPLLIDGEIVASGGSLTPGLVNSIVRGAHVRIVADKGRMAPGFCNSTALMVRKDLFDEGIITSASDLKGRKIMGSSDQTYGVFRSLALGNLTTADVEIIDLDYPSALVAFKNGAIDAGLIVEPYITQAVNSGAAVVLIPAKEYYPDYPTPLYFGPAFLDKNPDLGRRFMVAYLQGVHQYNEGKTERNLEILQIHTHLDRDLLKQSCWVAINEDGSVIRQPVKEYIDWMYENNKITQKLDEDQLFDMSFVTYANAIVKNTSPGS
jgi:NitT/TauT family transport system substrate-binding protein